jgi:hypothetical protein
MQNITEIRHASPVVAWAKAMGFLAENVAPIINVEE